MIQGFFCLLQLVILDLFDTWCHFAVLPLVAGCIMVIVNDGRLGVRFVCNDFGIIDELRDSSKFKIKV